MSSQKPVAPRQVAAFQSLRPVTVDAAATCGAQVGVNLRWPDGSLVTEADLRGGGTTVIKSSGPETTDDLPEGQYNWYGNVSTRDVAATAYTAALGDNDTILRGTADAGLTITVPAGVFPPDVTLYACQGGAGPVAFVAGAGVTFLPADSAQTRDQGSVIGLKQTSPNVWEPVGDLAYFFPATSVHANPAAASAQPVALAASADKQVLKRVGTTLQWVQQKAADVTFTPSGNLAATDVKSALIELDTEKVSYVALADNSSATPGAMLVGFKPSGGITSAKVGDALRELDTKKASVGGAETFAVAGGTADALTAAFTPAITALVDGSQLKVRAAAANTSTTPTLKVDALTARTITKNGNQALVAGDIKGAGHELLLRYVAAGPRFELLNPAVSGGGGGTGISLSGRVATYASLPTGLTSADAGKAYLVDADKLVYVWSGSAFPASGAGVKVAGVQSVTGTAVDNTDPLNPVINSTGGGGSSPYLLAYDEKPQGTAGGASLAGVNTRTLNTLAVNAISGAALAFSQLTLPAGTYYARATAPCYRAGRTALYLYNTTAASTLVRGQSRYVSATIDAGDTVDATGQFTLSASAVIELRHQIATATSGNGLGVEVGQASTGPERYAQVELWKLA